MGAEGGGKMRANLEVLSISHCAGDPEGLGSGAIHIVGGTGMPGDLPLPSLAYERIEAPVSRLPSGTWVVGCEIVHSLVVARCEKIMERYGPYRAVDQAWAIIREELDEFAGSLHRRSPDPSELLDVA